MYNGEGQRIRKTKNGSTINYYYQDGKVLYTTDGNGKITAHNIIGNRNNDIATVRYDGGKENYYTYNKDLKGSVSNILNGSGTGVVSYRYDNFGETTIEGNTQFYNEVCYTGAIYDASTGLYYMNARYYDPENGRFISQDTYRGEATDYNSWHLYAYCVNNPIKYVDPSENWVDTVLDVASIGTSAHDFKKNPSLGNGLYLAWDVVGAAVLFLPGSYVGKGIKATGKYGGKITKKATKKGAKRVSKKVTKKTTRKVTPRKEKAKVKKGSFCFVAGTEVLTKEGTVAIEKVTVGDMVWSESPETGEKGLKKVLETFESQTDRLVHVTVAGEEIITTLEHPFYVPGIGWMDAWYLTKGEKLVL